MGHLKNNFFRKISLPSNLRFNVFKLNKDECDDEGGHGRRGSKDDDDGSASGNRLASSEEENYSEESSSEDWYGSGSSSDEDDLSEMVPVVPLTTKFKAKSSMSKKDVSNLAKAINGCSKPKTFILRRSRSSSSSRSEKEVNKATGSSKENQQPTKSTTRPNESSKENQQPKKSTAKTNESSKKAPVALKSNRERSSRVIGQILNAVAPLTKKVEFKRKSANARSAKEQASSTSEVVKMRAKKATKQTQEDRMSFISACAEEKTCKNILPVSSNGVNLRSKVKSTSNNENRMSFI
jgi:hypothetical protein